LIHVPLFVMSHGGTIDAFIDAVFNFPTFTEAFKYAAYDGLQRLSRAEVRPGPEAAARTLGPRAMRAWFLGIALAGPVAPGRPLIVCEMDRWRRCRIRTWSYDAVGDGLLSPEAESEGFVAVVEEAESAADVIDLLRRRGARVLGGAPAEQAEVARARLASFWKAWSRGERPSRAAGAERRRRYEALRTHGLELPVGEAAVYGDELDAAACAYAAYLWATGQARVVRGVVTAADGSSVRTERRASKA
jgi:hypothetical protein